MEMMDWWVSMPKVELHAHLNGSVRNSTLLELAKELGEKGIIVFSEVEHVILKNDRSLTEVFKLFDLIHILTTDHATVTRITKEVVEDFAAENVVYLELRTTPKRNDSRGMSKRSYMEAVIEGLRKVDVFDIDFASTKNGLEEKGKSGQMIDDCVGFSRTKIYVRLLLSIDRRETLAAAMETVKLALEMKDLGVDNIFASFEICQRTRSSCYSALWRVLSRSLIRRKYMQCWTFFLRGLVTLAAWKRMHGEN